MLFDIDKNKKAMYVVYLDRALYTYTIELKILCECVWFINLYIYNTAYQFNIIYLKKIRMACVFL